MRRRKFLAAAAAATAASIARPTNAQPAPEAPAYFEWRTYRVRSAAKRSIVDNYLATAAFPAWQRLGIRPLGAFSEIEGDDASPLHVLLTFPTVESFSSAREALERDPDYQKNAVEYFAAAMNEPAIERIESWLMVSFDKSPQPAILSGEQGANFYELRTYESHNEERARAKIKMFRDGEIEMFRECGFRTAFFGEALAGPDLPQLKYMLASPDRARDDASWKEFFNHPELCALMGKAEYKGTVSRFSQLFLAPLPYSQL